MRLTSGQIRIDKDFTIDASNLTAPVTIDASGLFRVLMCAEGCRVSLSHLVITGGGGGSATDNGGGILSLADLELTNVVIRGNSANDRGGGIMFGPRGHLTMVNSQVSGNQAPVGAGIFAFRGQYSLRNCTISGNNATHGSAGIQQMAGACTIVNSTIAENTSPRGSAMVLAEAGNAILRNVTIASNRFPTAAPAYAVWVTGRSRLELQNCVVAANGDSRSYDIEVTLPSSVLTTTKANLIGRLKSEDGRILEPDVLTGTAETPIRPGLAKLGNYGGSVPTMPPLEDSPLIDAGKPLETALTVDARGLHRPVDGNHDGTAAIDLGAAEFHPEHDTDLQSMDPASATENGVGVGSGPEPPASEDHPSDGSKRRVSGNTAAIGM